MDRNVFNGVRMKSLVIISNRGREDNIRSLYRRLNAYVSDFDLLVLGECFSKEAQGFLAEQNVDIHLFRGNHPIKCLLFNALAFRRIVKEYRVVLSFGGHYGYGMLSALFSLSLPRFFFMRINGHGCLQPNKKNIFKKQVAFFCEWLGVRLSDVVCFNSYAMWDTIEERTGRINEGVVWYPGVPEKVFYPRREDLREQLEIPENDFVVGVVSKLTPVKRVGHVLEALSDLNLWVVVVGDGVLRPGLEKKAGENVVFVGWVDESELGFYYSTFDVLVSFSESESFGMPVTEAGLCGVPAVVSDVDGFREQIINGVSGLLVDPRDVVGLRAAVLLLFENPRLRRSMGACACSYVRRFSLDRVSMDCDCVFRRVLS